MILRDAVISGERRLLSLRDAGSAEHLAQMPRTEESAVPSPEFPAFESASLVADHEFGRPVPVTEKPLSIEAVAAWLAVQDSDTRMACASMLADEIEGVRESARAEGVAAGTVEGQRLAQQAVEERCATLQSLAAAADDAFEQDRLRLAEICADIVAEAFAKIAGKELQTRAAAYGVIVEILKRVKDGRELTIRVCPSDLALLQKEEQRLAAALPGRKFTVVGDARVDLGGAIVESNLGSLDGRLEVQLRELYETLRSAKTVHAELQ